MKGFLKFFALVVLLVPAWIAVLTMTGEQRLKQQPTVGPLVAVERALQGDGQGRWVSGLMRMDPAEPANAWRLEGLAAVPEGAGATAARPFVASLHTVCRPYSSAACWTVDRLDFPPVDDVSADTTAPQIGQEDEGAAKGLAMVQDQLRALGFDPGPSDGVMGLRTRQAIRDYVAQAGGEATEDAVARALVELEAMGRLARGAEHHGKGDYHAALADYQTAARLDPTNPRAYFNRGLILQDMGLPELAIADFDETLDLKADHVMAYRSRGNAHFAMGDYWDAFADHADGLGLRYLGERYLFVRDRLGEVRTQVAPGLAAVFNWAEGAWQQAKQSVAETLRRSDAQDGDKAT